MEEQAILFFGKFLRSAAGAQNHAEAALFFQRQGSRVNARGLQGFRGGCERQRQDPRHVLALALLHPGQFVEVRYLAGDLHRNFGRIKTRDASNSALSL